MCFFKFIINKEYFSFNIARHSLPCKSNTISWVSTISISLNQFIVFTKEIIMCFYYWHCKKIFFSIFILGFFNSKVLNLNFWKPYIYLSVPHRNAWYDHHFVWRLVWYKKTINLNVQNLSRVIHPWYIKN